MLSVSCMMVKRDTKTYYCKAKHLSQLANQVVIRQAFRFTYLEILSVRQSVVVDGFVMSSCILYHTNTLLTLITSIFC